MTENWRARAACIGHDPELWFPARPEDAQPAIDICQTCPVIEQCLAFAVRHRVRGIYGGLTATGRLERFGVTVDNGSPFDRDVRESREYVIAAMSKVGATDAEIAERVGTNAHQVHQARKKIA